MKPIKQHFAELLNLTQLYLLREYPLKEVKMVDPAILAFFQSKIKHSPGQPVVKKVQHSPITPRVPIQTPKSPVSSATVPSPSANPQPTHPLSIEAPPPETRSEPPPSEPLPPSPQSVPVVPDPKPPMPQDDPRKSKSFNLEPLKAASSAKDFREFWKLSPVLFPNWTLCETIPSDVIAQKHKNVWLSEQIITPVIILTFHDEEKHLTFLKNIAQAISLRLAPARVLSAPNLEKENGWENILSSSHLRLIIACDYGLYLQPKLMQFYREVSQQGKHFLNQIPLLLLSDLSLYLKEPQLKPLLWRAICNEFAAAQHRQ